MRYLDQIQSIRLAFFLTNKTVVGDFSVMPDPFFPPPPLMVATGNSASN